MSTSLKRTSPFNPRAWRLYRARPSTLIMALLAVFGSSAGMSFAQNVIVPKGTTATQLAVNGTVTSITTGTLRGTTAINAFSRFEVDRNNTVNLVVPSNAQVLLNMVTDAPVTVNGVVNSLKDGRIGGNVVFADPFGMIVGSAGALNVGSLMVTTPTRQFMDGVIGSDGTIDALSVSALLAGTAPASGLGTIRIDGTVNARDFIRLQGSDVTVNGALNAGADVAHQAAFLGAVNADGIAGGTALVDNAGVIEIVATGDVALAGRLSVDGNHAAAGQIAVHAGHDVLVAPGATVSARGQGAQADGGSIVLYGANNATLGAGAVLDASAGSTGNGGSVELSAAHTVTIAGGTMMAGAVGGKGGFILIDPDDLVWDGNQPGAHFDQFTTGGASIDARATNSITINNVVLSSRQVAGTATRDNIDTLASTGASGNITLTAPSITLSGNTRLLANAPGYEQAGGGVVTLTATGDVPGASSIVLNNATIKANSVAMAASTTLAQPRLGSAHATSSITVKSSSITADDVTLVAKNTVDSRFVYDGDTAVDKAAGLAETEATSASQTLALLAGANLVYSDVVANASVTIAAGSVITAAHAVELRAENVTKAGMATMYDPKGVPGVTPVGIGASYVSNVSNATVVVAAGAQITATDLTILAHNDASLEAKIKSPELTGEAADSVAVALGVSNADVNAAARVEKGAIIKVSGALSVAATNVGEYVNEVEAETGKEGMGVAAVAYAIHKSSATAALNADVKDATSVAVLAINNVEEDAVSASAEVGKTAWQETADRPAENTIGRAEKAVYGFLGLSKVEEAGEAESPKGSIPFRIGGAIAYATNSHTANASIGADASVHATDSVLVAARVIAEDTSVSAVSAAVSQSASQTETSSTANAYSAGLALANITHEAVATVGDNASVTASKIAVSANTEVPIRDKLLFGSTGSTDAFTHPDGIPAITEAVKNITDIGDVFNGVSSAKANPDGSNDSTGIYGSVSLLTMNDNARAEIGAGAHLLVSGKAGVTAATPWTTTFELEAAKQSDSSLGLTGTTPAKNETFSFETAATVRAEYDGTYLFLAGQAPGTGAAKGLGASVDQITLNNTTQAIVREGAVIEGIDESIANTAVAAGQRTWNTDLVHATEEVAVEASSIQRVVSLATAGGIGGTFGLNGTVTLNTLNSNVQALIDDEATVRAETLTLNATDTPGLWSIAGSLNFASSASVGVGIAINKVVANTTAEIADNDTLATDTATRVSMLAPGAGGTLEVRNLQVDARAGGVAMAVSVAGSVAYNSNDDSPGIISKLKGYYTKALETADTVIDTVTLKRKPKAPEAEAESTKKDPAEFTFAGAGSASANQTEMRTTALISGVTIEQGDDALAHSLAVRAVGDADIIAASGSAALSISKSASSTASVGIAGAIAVNQLGNGTSAAIDGTTVLHAGDVTVQALSAGQQLAVGIAAAVTVSGGNTQSSDQMVGSISVTQTLADASGATENFAHANIAGSTITGAATLAPTLDVTAYNHSYIGTGGGSLAVNVSPNSNGTEAALAFTYAELNSDVAAGIDQSTVTQFQSVGVHAYNMSQIVAGAALVGASTAPDATSLAGAAVVSLIRDTTSASIGGGSTIAAAGNVTVQAAGSGAPDTLTALVDSDDKRIAVVSCATGNAAGSCITSLAGAVQVSGGSNYGMSLDYSQIANATTASIGAATVTAGSIAVLADAATQIVSGAIGVGVSAKDSGAGSATLNFIDNAVSAQVGDATGATGPTGLSADSIIVNATDSSAVSTLAGQVVASKGSAVGAAVTVNDTNSTLSATVDHAALTARGKLTVSALNTSTIDALAVAGGASIDAAVTGSFALNFIANSTDAALRASTVDAGTGAGTPVSGNAILVNAQDGSTINALSGAAAAAGNAGVGAALSYNGIDNASRAVVAGSGLSGVDTLTVDSTLVSAIQSAAIALGAGNMGLAASVTINDIGATGNVASAALNDSNVTVKDVTSGHGMVTVTATDSSTIDSLAGSIAGGNAAIGAAAATNLIGGAGHKETTQASITGTKAGTAGLEVANLLVAASSTSAIRTIAVAGTAAGGGAVSGSIVVNSVAKDVSAFIDGGAKVDAADNIGVLATSADQASVMAGAVAGGVGAGFGVSTVFNQMNGAVRAYVDGATVDAGARDASSTLAVNSGDLSTQPDLGKILAPATTAVNLAEQQIHVRGLVVDASSLQSVNNIAASLGVGLGEADAVIAVVNLMGGDTSAYIHAASVNTREGATSANTKDGASTYADVNVLASSHAHAGDFAAGVAGSDGVAAAAAASATQTSRTTSAYITDAVIGTAATRTTTTGVDHVASVASVNGNVDQDPDHDLTVTDKTVTHQTLTSVPSVGAVNVQARTSQATADVVAGFGGGLVGGAVTGAVAIFSGTTTAYVERGTLTADSLAVDAQSSNAYNQLAASAAQGGIGGGSAFGVGVVTGTTDAHVGDRAASTTLALDGALSVTALTDSHFTSIAASAGIGGAAGVAGSAAVTLVQNSTTAGIYNVATSATAPATGTAGAPVFDADGNSTVTTDLRIGGLLASALGAVKVNAGETVVVTPDAGAVGLGGGAGVGAAANVVVIKSSVTGEIIGSTIGSAANVAVTATSDKQVDMTTASGGASISTGIGGAVGVLLVGSGNTGDANAELDAGNSGTLTQVDAMTMAPNQADGSGAAPQFALKNAVEGLAPDAVTARISGGTVTAKDVTVAAEATTATKNLTGAAGIGGDLGAGGAASVARVYSTVAATIDNGNMHADVIDVHAVTQDGAGRAASATSYAGGLGLVGLGAAVSDALVQNSVTARASGVFTGTGAGAMSVGAIDETSVAASGIGAAAGAAAIGVVVSYAAKDSTIGTLLGAGSTVQGFGQLAVFAKGTTSGSNATVDAQSTGAAGGLLVAGAGAVSTATNTTRVSAAIGDNVTLPDGDVIIGATNDSRQSAAATGIGAGLLAASGAVARAQSGSAGDAAATSATLGNHTITSAGRAGYLQVTASGTDVNTAVATAAAGGAIAGNASAASTFDYADVRATVGNYADVNAGAVLVNADHIDAHYDHADSLNASLVGGSGAASAHTADVNVAAAVGAGSTLASTGTVQVLADNIFQNDTVLRGESASGAGGGVFNGAAASSVTSITANADITLGDQVTLTSGPSATTSPFTMVLLAANHLSLSDTVVLGTGGAIATAGVTAHTTALLNSNVVTGLGDQLDSLGGIGIGSYANAAASASALVQTYGILVVGSAGASVGITANQAVNIGGGGSRIRSFGNIDVTAGEDPTGNFNTVLTGNASAQGYTRGLIAVPEADASTSLISNAALNIASGATVESAQNAVVGAYQGASNAVANGTGHGFELGFIPVTDGSSSTGTASSAVVTIDGNVNAGIYHDLAIHIADCQNSGIYCSTATLSQGSAPATLTYVNDFDAAAFVRANFSDPATQALMLSGVAAGLTGAFEIGPLYAAGGTVTVNAGTLRGAGKVTSYGAPTITVVNDSPDMLLMSSVTMPNTPGGQVIFTGTAGRDAAVANGMTVTETGATGTPTVTIQNTYSGNVGGVDFGPALMLTAAVTNQGGDIKVSNATGSIGESGQVLGATVSIDSPNGVFVAELADDKGPFYAGSNPYAEWQKAMIWPGGNPALAAPSADLAIAYVASAVYGAAAFGSDTYGFNQSFVHGAGTTAPNNFSTIFYGASYRYTDSAGVANAASPIGQSIALDGKDYSYIPMVPTEVLTRSLTDYTQATLNSSITNPMIHGAKIAIVAKYIDVNGTITAGQPTNWSVDMPATLAATLADVTAKFNLHQGSQTYVIDPVVLGLGDAAIVATFDAVTQQITLANVSASSGGGSVLLKGQILSTNTLGNIHVNGGYGKVTIANESGYALNVQDINAGTSSTGNTTAGTVEIIDTSPTAPSHVLYAYSPATGVQEYRGAITDKAAQLVLVDPGASTVTGAATATYQPTLNQRWEWTDSATLRRSITIDRNSYTVTAGNWQFVGDTNNPWAMTSSGVVTGHAGDPVFQETVTGAITSSTTRKFGYGGCDNAGDSSCNFGFAQTNDTTNPYRGWWNYNYVTGASLALTSSVKADNPIKVDFAGNATGSVSITSNGAVTLGGQIVNATGLTTVTGAGITQGATGTLAIKDLTLASTQGIGTTQKAVSATLGAGGVLNATSGSAGIYLDLASGATIGTVQAGSTSAGLGDVQINATGSLLAASTGATNIAASNITLASRQGAVGSDSAPMLIHAIGNPGVNGTLGGVVNIKAHDAIDLRQVDGDLLVGQIASTGNGDVTIGVANGTIYDARGQTAANTLTTAQVQEVWDLLKLTGAAGWTDSELRYAINRAALAPTASTQVGDATANIVGHAVTIATSAAIGKLAPSVYIALADLESGQLTDLQKVALGLAKAAGDVVAVGSDSAGNTVTFTFGQTPAGVTLTGFQLAQTSPLFIDATGAIKLTAGAGAVFLQGTGTNRDLQIDNVSATGAVNLTAPESIVAAVNPNGSVLAPVQINAGGDVRLVAGSGDLGTAAHPLSYQAAGVLALATAGQSMYLQTQGDMRLGGVAAGKVVSLDAPTGSILATNQNAGLTISGHDIVLNAAIDLGIAANPLRVATTGGSLDGVAGGSVWLTSPNANDTLGIGTLQAGGAIALVAAGDVSANKLVAGGAVAVQGADVTLDRASAGAIAVTAGGDLTVGNLVSRSGVDTNADGHTEVTGDVEGGTTVTMQAADIAMDAGSAVGAGGAVQLTARTGDAALARVSGTGVAISAAKRVLSVQPAVNVLATGTHGQDGLVTLRSTGPLGGIGAPGAALGVNAANLVAVATSGDIDLDLWSNTRATEIDGALGTVNVAARASLNADRITGATVALAVAQDLTAATVTASQASASVQAGGAVNLGTLTTAGAANVAAGATATLGTVTVGDVATQSALAVTAGGALSVGVAAASQDIALTAASAQLGQVDAGRDLLVTVAGNAALTRASAGRQLDLRAGSAAAGTLASLGDASLVTTRGNLSVGTLSAQTLAATAAGDAALTTATVHGAAAVQAGGALAVGRFNADGNTTFNAGGAASLGQVAVLADLAAASGGALSIDTASATGNMTLDAGSAVAGTLAAGGAVKLTTQGDLRVAALTAATLAATAQGDATLTQSTVHGVAAVRAGRALAVRRFNADGNTTFNAGGAASLGQVAVLADLAAASGGALSIDTASATGNMTLDAGSAVAGTLAAGGAAKLTTKADLRVAALTAATLGTTAQGDATLTQATVHGVAAVQAGGALAVGRFAGAGNASFNAGGAASLDQVDAGADLAVTSGGAQSIGKATASGDIALRGASLGLTTAQAGRDIAIVMDGRADVASATAARQFNLLAGSAGFGTIGAETDAQLTTRASLAGASLHAATVAVTAGSDAQLGQIAATGVTSVAAGGALDVTTLASLGATSLMAGGNATLGTVTVGDAAHAADLAVNAGGALSATTVSGVRDVLLQGAAMALGSVTVGNDLALQAGQGNASYTRLAAGRDVTATVAGSLAGASGGVLTAARDVRIAAGAFAFDQASAGGSVTIAPVSDVTGNTLQAGADIRIRSSGTVEVANMRANGAADLDAAVGVKVGTLRAATLRASTPGTLSMDVLVDSGELAVGAGTIAMKVTSGGPRLVFDLTGYRGGVADNAALTVDASAGTTFPHFDVKNAMLTTNADANTFASAYVTGTMLFTNPSGQMYMNNVTPASVAGSLLQLVQPTYGFTLAQEGLYYTTDAYVTQFAPQYRPVALNHQQSRADSTILAYAASAARTIGSADERLRSAPRLDGEAVFMRPTGETQLRFELDTGTPAVNWGDDVTNVPPQAIQLAANSHAPQQ